MLEIINIFNDNGKSIQALLEEYLESEFIIND
jgi:hypothetical protein